MHHEFHYLLKLLLLITASIILYIFSTMTEIFPLFQDPFPHEAIDSMETYIRLLISPRYKIAFCPMQKSMSTVILGMMCYLENEARLNKSKHLNEGWNFKDICMTEGSPTYLTGKAASDFLNGPKGAEYLKIAVVREPLERFLSGYADKCSKQLNGEYRRMRDCYECNGNMECVLETLYVRAKQYLKGNLNGHVKPEEVPYTDRHLLPQSWSCDFKHHSRDYKILKYNTDNPNTTLDEVFAIFRNHNVRNDTIIKLQKQVYGKYTHHSTFAAEERIEARRQLLASRHMLAILDKIFHTDYKLFHFVSPLINY